MEVKPTKQDFIKSVENTKGKKNAQEIKTDEIIISKDGIFARRYNKKGEEQTPQNVCKKPIYFKYILKSKDSEETERLMQIGNADNPLYMTIKNSELCSAVKFKEKLLNEQINLRFTTYILDSFLDAQPILPSAIKIDTLGYNAETDAYYFSNAVAKGEKIYEPNEFGIAEIDGKCVFMPYTDCQNATKEETEQSKRFIYTPCNTTFKEWFSMMHRCYGDTAVISAVYTIASMFRDIIYNNCRFYPMLYFKGSGSNGKSTLISLLTRLFGEPQSEVNFNNANTMNGLERFMSGARNTIIAINEFPSDNDEIRDKFMALYDGGGSLKAQFSNDKKTHSITTEAGVVITSNFTPTHIPLFQRFVYVELPKLTDKQIEEASDIINIDLSKNFSAISVEIMKHRALIEKEFSNTYSEVKRYFRDQFKGQDIEPRYTDNRAAILTPILILITNKLIDFGMDGYSIIDVLLENLKDQIEIGKLNDSVSEFWIAIQHLLRNYKIKMGYDVKFMNDKGCVSVNINNCFLPYSKELGSKAKNKSTLVDLLRNSKAFIDSKPVKFTDPTKGKKTCTTGLLFDYQRLKDDFGVDFENFEV